MTLTLLFCACAGQQKSETSAIQLAATDAAAVKTETQQAVPEGQLDEDVIPTAYRIELDINPELEEFVGAVEIDIDIRNPYTTIYLHGADLNVDGCVFEQNKTPIAASYKQLNEHGLAAVTLPVVPKEGAATLKFHYHAPFTKGLRGLYKVMSRKNAYAFTQFEATSARYAFPSFDEPRFKTPFQISVLSNLNHRVVTTTPLKNVTEREDGKKMHVFETTTPLPTYLLSFSVGELEIVNAPDIPANALRHRAIPFRAVTVKGQSEHVKYALKETPQILEAIERYFNVPYPFKKLDIIAVPDFRAGAMENVGAITFREIFLLIDAPHASANQKRRFANIMAHELGHMWFGNLVTTAWWDDIWLNEAFATWLAAKIVHQVYPQYDYPVLQWSNTRWAMGEDSLTHARQIREPIQSEHDISSAFDAITYQKGAQFLSMLETWMGEDAFRQGMTHYMNKHAFGNTTYQDLIDALETQTTKSITPVAKSFLFQPGVPYVTLSEKGLSQERYRPLGVNYSTEYTWHIPVCGAHTKGCTVLNQPTHAFHSSAQDQENTTTTLSKLSNEKHLNLNGAGYYRFWPGDDVFMSTKQSPTLSVLERMSFVDSVIARFEMGRLPVSDFIPFAARIVESEENLRISSQVIEPLTFILRNVPEEKRLERIQQLKPSFRKLFDRIGLFQKADESATITMVRPYMVDFFTFELNDNKSQRRLAEKAWDYLGFTLNGDVIKDAVPADLVPQILRAGLRQHGQQFNEIAINRFKSTYDPLTRSNLLSALSTQQSLAERKRFLELTRTEDTRENEVMMILMYSASQQPDWTWQFVVENYDAISQRIPVRQQARLTKILSYASDLIHLDTLDQFFGSKIEQMSGGPRQLSLSKEKIKINHALKSYINTPASGER